MTRDMDGRAGEPGAERGRAGQGSFPLMTRGRRFAPPLLAAALAAAALTIAAAPARAGGPTYVTSFGTAGSGSGQFNYPNDLAVSGGLVYVADFYNSRIDRFDPTNFAASFTSFDSPGQLNGPFGVAVNGGLVYVTSDNQVDRFDPNNFAASFTSFRSSFEPGPGQFYGASGLAVDGSGNVYVGDPGDGDHLAAGAGVPMEDVRYLAGHAEPRTTTLDDRRKKRVTRNIVERIPI
jgi:hypothetical protein